MIASRVLGAVGAAVDWSLIHLLAAISDRVEGRGADCYRRADALADMEAAQEVWEPAELGLEPMKLADQGLPTEVPECWACGCPESRHFLNAGLHWPCSDCSCLDLMVQNAAPPQSASAAVTTPAADNTTDHVTGLLNYHIPVVVSSGFWGCEGCSWIGPKTGHSRHVAELITDMTAASGRVQQKLDGAS